MDSRLAQILPHAGMRGGNDIVIFHQFGAYAGRVGRNHVGRFISDYLVVNQSNLQKYKEHQRKSKLAWSGVDSPGDL
ncbi:MAG: hypothetical protein ACYS9C_17185, partial [Planctomycetota bacterium]